MSREPLANLPGWTGSPCGYGAANAVRLSDPTGLAPVDVTEERAWTFFHTVPPKGNETLAWMEWQDRSDGRYWRLCWLTNEKSDCSAEVTDAWLQGAINVARVQAIGEELVQGILGALGIRGVSKARAECIAKDLGAGGVEEFKDWIVGSAGGKYDVFVDDAAEDGTRRVWLKQKGTGRCEGGDWVSDKVLGRLKGGGAFRVGDSDGSNKTFWLDAADGVGTSGHLDWALGSLMELDIGDGICSAISLWGAYDPLYFVRILPEQFARLAQLNVSVDWDISWAEDDAELWNDIVGEGTGRSAEVCMTELTARFQNESDASTSAHAARSLGLFTFQAHTTLVVRSLEPLPENGVDEQVLSSLRQWPGINSSRARVVALGGTGRPFIRLTLESIRAMADLGTTFELVVAP